MEIKPIVKEALIKIDFVNKAKELTEKYSFNRENSFKNYDNKEVFNIFQELGYKAKYDKRENFFQIKEKVEDNTFKFHISFKYGFVEMGLYLFKNNKFYDGYVWSVLVELLDINTPNLKDPCFHTYDELKEILKEAFEMYENFKKEVYENERN